MHESSSNQAPREPRPEGPEGPGAEGPGWVGGAWSQGLHGFGAEASVISLLISILAPGIDSQGLHEVRPGRQASAIYFRLRIVRGSKRLRARAAWAPFPLAAGPATSRD